MDSKQMLERYEAELAAKELRGALLLVLEARFASLPDAIRGRIEGTQDPKALRRWVPLAATAGLGELERRIEQDLTAPG
jgi:hypothetical protein